MNAATLNRVTGRVWDPWREIAHLQREVSRSETAERRRGLLFQSTLQTQNQRRTRVRIQIQHPTGWRAHEKFVLVAEIAD